MGQGKGTKWPRGSGRPASRVAQMWMTPRRLRGATREGAALLAGLVVCGHCGHQMRVSYTPAVRYFCNALTKTHAGPGCLHLEAGAIEGAVVDAFFAALAPAELYLLEEVLAARRTDGDLLRRQHADQVARAEYEARLAEKRFLAVAPENRLVAADLERRWEEALHDLAAAREAAERVADTPAASDLDPELRAQIRDVGAHLPALWASGRLTTAHKKDLLRALVRRVILARPAPDTVDVKVVWVSGAFTQCVVRPALQRTSDAADYGRMVARIRTLSALGQDDALIARHLSAEGFRRARREGPPAT